MDIIRVVNRKFESNFFSVFAGSTVARVVNILVNDTRKGTHNLLEKCFLSPMRAKNREILGQDVIVLIDNLFAATLDSVIDDVVLKSADGVIHDKQREVIYRTISRTFPVLSSSTIHYHRDNEYTEEFEIVRGNHHIHIDDKIYDSCTLNSLVEMFIHKTTKSIDGLLSSFRTTLQTPNIDLKTPAGKLYIKNLFKTCLSVSVYPPISSYIEYIKGTTPLTDGIAGNISLTVMMAVGKLLEESFSSITGIYVPDTVHKFSKPLLRMGTFACKILGKRYVIKTNAMYSASFDVYSVTFVQVIYEITEVETHETNLYKFVISFDELAQIIDSNPASVVEDMQYESSLYFFIQQITNYIISLI